MPHSLPAFDVRDPDLRWLYEYWRERCGESAAPRRDQIDPADMIPMLGRISLVDTAEDLDGYCVRLFGTTLCCEFGEERTGLSFSRIRRFEHFDEVMARYLEVARTVRPHYDHVRTVSGLRSYRGYSRLLLPLSEDGNSVSMILTGFTFFGQVG